MKIVVVSFYQAFPPTFGSASVTYNLTKYLPGEKHLIHLSGNGKNKIKDKNISLVNIKGSTTNNFFKILNLSVRFTKIIAEIKKISPEFIIFEGAAWVMYYFILFLFLKFNKIKSKIIYHGHCVEYLLRKEKNNVFIAIITKWAENLMLRKCDFVTAVSEIDAMHLEKIYGVKTYILPNGVDIGKFRNVTSDEIERIKKKYNLNKKILLFMGLPEFKPNKEAINFLVKTIMPEVLKEYPDLKLAIIGGKVNFSRKWLINPGNIPFEEVPAFIKACDICLAPIFSGSGTRLKILEYLAAEKPVISTTKGAEGIAVNNKKNIVIVDNIYKYAEEIVYILEHEKFAKEMGYEGMKTVRADYSWQSIMQKFNKTFSTCCPKNIKGYFH